MAIKRPKAIDAAPARRPQRSEGCRPGEFLVSRGMGGSGSPRDLSRGVIPQGKKVERRHCGIGDRGAAVLRLDQAIEEAVWAARDRTLHRQGEPANIVSTGQETGWFRRNGALSSAHRARTETPSTGTKTILTLIPLLGALPTPTVPSPTAGRDLFASRSWSSVRQGPVFATVGNKACARCPGRLAAPDLRQSRSLRRPARRIGR